MIALALAAPLRAEPVLRLLSETEWQVDADWFGGFSGIEVLENGDVLYVISDRGTLLSVQAQRENDALQNLKITDAKPVVGPNGRPLVKRERDLEGLAIAPGGAFFASFENDHRVAMLDPLTGRATNLPGHPDFDDFAVNGGFEALAAHPDDRLFALVETAADASGTTPLYTFENGVWRVHARLPLSGPFRPVGADFDAQGRLYLLERTLTPLGFRSRIRRADIDVSPARIETLFASFPAAFDNLEGLAVWTDSAGGTRLTLISDDNFFALQTTQIVEFAVER